jgi:3-phenylpropionate/trans-cinnamate dioxygenase ferredoxin subunit
MTDIWHDVGAADEVTADAPLSVKVEGRNIGIYLLAGRYYAVDDLCPHADALLSQGFILGEDIECPLHGARFHVPSGKHLDGPGNRDLECFAVKREGGRLLVRRND